MALPRYTILDLGTLGGAHSQAYGLNNAGQVVGSADTADGRDCAFLWKEGTMYALDTPLAGVRSAAQDINDSGEIIGWCGASAMFWQTPEEALALAPGSARSRGWALNNLGQAVGELAGDPADADARSQAVLLSVPPLVLDTEESCARDINSSTQVIGHGRRASGEWRAFLWEAGACRDLDTLGGGNSRGYGINNFGQVVGQSECAQGCRHAFLWQDGQMRKLDVPGDESVALGINDRGQIIGACQPIGQPFLYSNGMLTPLEQLLPRGSDWALLTVMDINDQGQMVGWGYHHSAYRAYLLSPT